jgi:hypothetical protein
MGGDQLAFRRRQRTGSFERPAVGVEMRKALGIRRWRDHW